MSTTNDSAKIEDIDETKTAEQKDTLTEQVRMISENLQSVETAPKKKSSPFLAKETKIEVIEEDNEESSAKKQHEIIDKLSKDKSIFNNTGKLYFVSTKTNKPETRGEGKFLILKDDTGLFKLMMIRDQVMLKGCNHYISPSCPLTKATQAKNSWIWTAIGDKSDAEKNEEKTIYFAMFKDEETSRAFEEKYNEAKTLNQSILDSKKLEETEASSK